MALFHRRRTRTALLIVAATLLAGWLIPPFFHTGRYTKILRANLESKLGRPVELGAVTLRLLPHPGFSIQNVLIEEDPRFGAEPFARVGQVECDLRWRSLWGSRLDCWRILLSHPVLNVVRNSDGQWNVAEFFHRGSTEAKAAAASSHRPAAEPFDLEVDGARVNFTVNSVERPFALDKVRARLRFDPRQGSVQFRVEGTPLRTDLARQPPGPLVLTGEWKPAAGFNGPFQARLTTSGSLISGWIPLVLRRDPGVYGLVNADVHLAGNIHEIKIAGQIGINQLHRSDSLPPSSEMPVSLSFTGNWNREGHRVQIQKADAAFAGSQLHLTGVIAQISGAPYLNLVLALNPSRVEDLVAMANRLAKHPTRIAASGRADGRLTLEGPWQNRRYGGFLALHALALRTHGVEISAPQAEIRVDDRSARLAPAHFLIGVRIRGVAEGTIPLPAGSLTALPRGASPRSNAASAFGRGADTRGYEFVFTLPRAPLRDCIRVARSLGVRNLRDIEATGWAGASVRLTGRAWPFSRPQVGAEGNLDSARLLVAGLNEPVRFSRFHFALAKGTFIAMPITAGIGDATFSGWLQHGPLKDAPWRFNARAPRLGLEQAALWFTVLGYRRPKPILDLIPGLRSLAGRASASRSVFAAVNAQGTFECPEVTFHSLDLEDFRAGITLSGRAARISEATFRVAGGTGEGSAAVDFKQAPARIAAQFGLSGVALQRFAGRLPAALTGIRGVLSAAGRLATRGLTRPEMAAHLTGSVQVRLRNVGLGEFDPLAAAARGASLGALAPERAAPRFPLLNLNLLIDNQTINLRPVRLRMAGAALSLAGTYNFSGAANLTVRADMTHVNRRWLGEPLHDTPQRRAANVRLTGRLKSLTVTPLVEAAGLQH
ncbi:MAG: AsmA family protein [Terriglobia bacterium]